jgi:hypothetical protein
MKRRTSARLRRVVPSLSVIGCGSFAIQLLRAKRQRLSEGSAAAACLCEVVRLPVWSTIRANRPAPCYTPFDDTKTPRARHPPAGAVLFESSRIVVTARRGAEPKPIGLRETHFSCLRTNCFTKSLRASMLVAAMLPMSSCLDHHYSSSSSSSSGSSSSTSTAIALT